MGRCPVLDAHRQATLIDAECSGPQTPATGSTPNVLGGGASQICELAGAPLRARQPLIVDPTP